MNVGELLHELRVNILHDRSGQIAGIGTSYLWDDDTLVRYIDEAQCRLARKTGLLRDKTTPAVTQFNLVANQELYELDPSILSVMSVRLAGDSADLARAGHTQFDTYSSAGNQQYFWDVATLATLPPDKPRAYSTDEDEVMADDGTFSIVHLRMYPVPSAQWANTQVTMRVTRLPLSRLSAKQLDFTPEIPRVYHLQMLDWAAYLALRMNDLDGGDPVAAERFRQSFAETVEEVSVEVKDKMFQPAAWGFGRGGFSYQR